MSNYIPQQKLKTKQKQIYPLVSCYMGVWKNTIDHKNTYLRLRSVSPLTSQWLVFLLTFKISDSLFDNIIKLRKGWKKISNDLENKYICNFIMGLLVFSCRLFLLHDNSVLLWAIDYICFRRWWLAKPINNIQKTRSSSWKVSIVCSYTITRVISQAKQFFHKMGVSSACDFHVVFINLDIILFFKNGNNFSATAAST